MSILQTYDLKKFYGTGENTVRALTPQDRLRIPKL